MAEYIGVMEDGYEHNNRVYPFFGFCPSLSGREYKDPIKVLVEEEHNDNPIIFMIDDTYGYEENPRIYREYSPSLRSSRGGHKILLYE